MLWARLWASPRTWEPVSSFVPRINTPFNDYFHRHTINHQVPDLEALTWAIEAVGN